MPMIDQINPAPGQGLLRNVLALVAQGLGDCRKPFGCSGPHAVLRFGGARTTFGRPFFAKQKLALRNAV